MAVAKKRRLATARGMSRPRASESGLPVSIDSARANFSRSRSIKSAMRYAPHQSNGVLIYMSRENSIGGARGKIRTSRNGGEGGIRTLGTLLGYGALAKRCFRPLSHLTNNVQEYDEQLPVANSMREIRHASNFAPIQRQSDSRE